MLDIFQGYRDTLDETMLLAMHKRVTLWGYGYSGRFIKWYAEYYHNIKIDYIISLDMRTGQVYEDEIFRKSILDFDYKDVKETLIWISEPLEQAEKKWLESKGYKLGNNAFDFCGLLKNKGMYATGIQFMAYLEDVYGCDFVTAVETKDFTVEMEHAHAYRCTTQKEIFPILDRCHCVPKANDSIFDFGCGKGAALISFLDYGFERIGGVEFEPRLFNICNDNFKKIGLSHDNVCLIEGNALELTTELDSFNWFYFFQPFDRTVFSACIEALCNSYFRRQRKIRIISISPESCDLVTNNNIFRLTNQFTVAMRQRVVDVYESY